MAQMTIPDDIYVAGNIACQTISLPQNCVNDVNVPTGTNINDDKLMHRFYPTVQYGNSATAVTAITYFLYRCAFSSAGSATIDQFGVGAVTPAGSGGSVTVKLLKNGSDILSADITLDSTTGAYDLKLAAGFSSNTLVAGDVLEVQVSSLTVGGGAAAGFFAQAVISEYPN